MENQQYQMVQLDTAEVLKLGVMMLWPRNDTWRPAWLVAQLSFSKASVLIHPTPLSRAGCDERSVFKRSLISLNSRFSFFKTGHHSKLKEPSLNYSVCVCVCVCVCLNGPDVTQVQFLSGV